MQANVTENVVELRKALGSLSKPLSLRDFAELIGKSHPDREISANMVQRWEAGHEPDVISIAIMARLAGVRFEHFALGKRHRMTELPSGEASIADGLIDPARDRKLSPEEEQRALRAAEGQSSASAKKPRAKAKKRGAGGK